MQTLSEKQAATELRRPNSPGGFVFTIPDIKYSLNATGATCSQMQYLCVRFDHGDNPQPDKAQLRIHVDFVRGENDARILYGRPTPGCTQFITCKGNNI